MTGLLSACDGTSELDPLFTDTPSCEGEEASAVVKVVGELDGYDVEYEDSEVSSLIGGGQVRASTYEAGKWWDYVLLQYEGDLDPGKVLRTKGALIDLPDGTDSGAGPYCILEGELGEAPSEADTEGRTIKFTISKVRKRTKSTDEAEGACEGPEIAVDLRGCLAQRLGELQR